MYNKAKLLQLLWICAIFHAWFAWKSVESVDDFLDSEYLTLYDFYNATNGIDWVVNGVEWQFSTPVNPCIEQWQGLTCDNSSGIYHVVEVELSSYNLVGTIPNSIVNLTQLSRIDLNSNYLSSHLPNNLGQLSLLQYIDLYDNGLTGSIPVNIGDSTLLLHFDVGGNKLTGGLPASLGNATSLQYLDINSNQLTGSALSFLHTLTQLTLLDVSRNAFSGTIPTSLHTLAALQYLDLSKNSFSSSIPAFLGKLTQLQVVGLSNAALTGTLPVGLWDLPQLQQLYIQNTGIGGHLPDFPFNASINFLYLSGNRFSGSIPESIERAADLVFMDLTSNHLTGSIPNTLSACTNMIYLALASNYIHGTISTSVYTLQYMSYLFLSGNLLSGTLSTALSVLQVLDVSDNSMHGSMQVLSQLPLLSALFLQGNHFSGSLTGVFNSTQTNLLTIQLDNNQFTGTLPTEIFALPALATLSIVGSCLHGTLPENVCEAKTLKALVLYGLTTGTTCRATGTEMLSLYPHSTFTGSLPSCLLTLPRLQTLLLSSNGLTGSMTSEWAVSDTLLELDLSHNLISGTIPNSIQNHTWLLLDLSHNYLRGVLQPELFSGLNRSHFREIFLQRTHGIGRAWLNSTASHYSGLSPSLKLSTNRLSGRLPSAITSIHNLSVLAGNLFDCNYEHSNLPRYDGDVSNYECASNAFDISMYVWLSAVCILVLYGVYYRSVLWVDLVSHVEVKRLDKVYTLLHTYNSIVLLAWYCAGVAVVVLMPYYAIISQYEGTHTHQYAYVLSAIYSSGVAAFTVDTVLWMALLACVWVWVQRTHSDTTNTPMKTRTLDFNYIYVYVLFALVNVTAVLGVNIAFVYSVLYGSSQAHTPAQVAVSIFKTVWNTTFSPYVLRRLSTYYLSDASIEKERFFTLQLLVALFNNIAIPCLVVMAIDPNCFSSILLPQESDSATYVLPTCDYLTNGDALCQYATSSVYHVDFTPPFTYSYQCSASFITSYAPAFVYMSLSTVVLTPLLDYFLLQAHSRLHPDSRLHRAVTYMLPRLLTPPAQVVPSAYGERELVGATGLLVTLFTHLGILLTFGVVFPPVALAMAVSVTAVVYMARYKLRRFLQSVVDAQLLEYMDVINTECASVGSGKQMIQAINSIICYCSAFYTLFLFDTLGDTQGFRASVWVLIVVPLKPYVLLGVVWRTNRKEAKCVEIDVCVDSVELSEIKSSNSVVCDVKDSSVCNVREDIGTVNPILCSV